MEAGKALLSQILLIIKFLVISSLMLAYMLKQNSKMLKTQTSEKD